MRAQSTAAAIVLGQKHQPGLFWFYRLLLPLSAPFQVFHHLFDLIAVSTGSIAGRYTHTSVSISVNCRIRILHTMRAHYVVVLGTAGIRC